MHKWIVTEDYVDMSKHAAREIATRMEHNQSLVLGLSTGGTPLGVYRELTTMHQENNLDFSNIITFNLDEYVGLASEHPQSYTYYMWENLFSKINIDKANIHIPKGIFKSETEVTSEYDQKLRRAKGIDLMILGIGRNGHIGFNEPNECLSAGTHIASLSEETIKDNARFFNHIDEVPKKAVAMGVGSILQSKHILLIASGEEKAMALKNSFNGKIGLHCPSSLLQLHANVTIVVDKEAVSLCNID